MPTNAIALSRLLVAERQSLVRLAQRIVGSSSAAEDVTQSLWFKVQRVEDDPPIANKRAFLFRLASNLATDHLRAVRRHDALFETGDAGSDVAGDEPDAEARLLDREKVVRLAAIVEEMPLRCRQVFVLVKLEELSVGETADRLDISQDMVRKHIRHALQICHKSLNGGTA